MPLLKPQETATVLRPDLTLVTYTYNDPRLVHDLLAALPAWTIQPGHILVVDDGSTLPFTHPDAEILRLEPNRGPARAKHLGISAAQTPLILSLDNDIRPHPQWLAAALPLALDPAIGLIGSNITWQTGPDAASRYLARFCNYHAEQDNLVFLAAGIWLLRRATWTSLGGFGEYESSTHEDYYFSRKVAAAGLALTLCDTHPVHEVRRMGRTALVRRMVRYTAAPILPVLDRLRFSGILPVIQAKADNITNLINSNDLDLIYIELLLFASYFLYLFHSGVHLLEDSTNETADLTSALTRLLLPYPRLFSQFTKDLNRIGYNLTPHPDTPTPSIWDNVLNLLIPQELHPVLTWLEHSGLDELVRTEQAQPADFHYLGG